MALALSDVVADATTSDNTADATRTVNLPTAGVSEGDMMFICMSIHKEAADIGDVLTTPTGWTRVTEQALPDTASTPRAYLFKRRIPGGGLGSTVDITSSDTAIGHTAVAFAVQNASEELDVLGTWNTGFDTTAIFPAVTATKVGGLIIRIAVMDDDKETSQPALSAHTAINWAEVELPTNGSTTLVYKALQPSTTVATASLTIVVEQWAANTFVISEATGPNIVVPLGTFTLAGQVPSIETGVTVPVPLKTFTLTGQIPIVGTGAEVIVPLDTFIKTGFIPTINIGVNIVVPLNTFTLIGQIPTIETGVTIITPLGTFILTGFIPIIAAGAINIIVPFGSFTVNFIVPSVASGVSVATPLRTFSLTGFIPTIEATDATIITVPLNTFTLTKFIPTIHAVDKAKKALNEIDLTPPFDDISQIRYLVRNFALLRDVLETGVTGQFTTADGKTIHIRNGVVIDIF